MTRLSREQRRGELASEFYELQGRTIMSSQNALDQMSSLIEVAETSGASNREIKKMRRALAAGERALQLVSGAKFPSPPAPVEIIEPEPVPPMAPDPQPLPPSPQSPDS